jgi:hypothetical protein
MGTWDYFLEAEDGTIISVVRNVKFKDAPHGAELDEDGEVLGHWHPYEGGK